MKTFNYSELVNIGVPFDLIEYILDLQDEVKKFNNLLNGEDEEGPFILETALQKYVWKTKGLLVRKEYGDDPQRFPYQDNIGKYRVMKR